MNIKEIAKAAGVSTTTVSRIINNKGYVSEGVRRRVMDVIEEYNYVPSGVARSMSHGRTKTIGLILPDITNPFFPNVARGVEDTANTFGYKVVLCNSDEDLSVQEQYLYTLREHRVDGLIIISSANANDIHDLIEKIYTQVPVVFCDRIPDECKYDSVQTHHYRGAELAVEYLIGLGHKKIAMIGGPPIPSSVERTQAFLDVCGRNNIAVPEGAVVESSFRAEMGYDAMKKILTQWRPTAVFCANDMIAFGAMDAIMDENLSVPDDISIVGYDNILFAKYCRPSLTTVNQPTYLLGVTAFELLQSQIEDENRQVVQTTLEPDLVVRNSCGPLGG